MSSLTIAVARPLYGHVSIARLAVLLRIITWGERVSLSLACLLFGVIALQLIYPHDRSLPLMHRELALAAATPDELNERLSELNKLTYGVSVADKTYKLSAQASGSVIDVSAAQNQLLEYSWRDRLIPFSILRTKSTDLPRVSSPDRSKTAQQLAAEGSYAPKNATVTKASNGNFTVVPAKDGLQTTEGNVEEALALLGPDGQRQTEVVGWAIKPSITDDTAKAVAQKAVAITKNPARIAYNGRVYTVPAEAVASWTRIIDQDRQLIITFDEIAIQSWLGANLPLVIAAPKASTITVVDGVETSRSQSSGGEGLDVTATAALIAKTLEAGKAEIAAVIKPLDAVATISRSYSPTNQGLAVLIKDWADSHRASNVSVHFQELSGPARSASYNAGKQRASASIYKLYLSVYLYKQMEAGSVNVNSYIINGKNIPQCIEAMIVVSDNPCGNQLGDIVDWATVTSYLRSLGLSATDLDRVPVQSSAADSGLFLHKLYSGQLISAANRDTLLGYMGRQVYRIGIPAAAPGATVYDKVGWLPGVWNDAAIVTVGDTTYILTIYTSTNPEAIRDLAARIHSLLY